MKKHTILYFIGILLNTAIYSETTAKPWSELSFILKPSTIPGAGVGVFATHDMKANTPLFRIVSISITPQHPMLAVEVV